MKKSKENKGSDIALLF